MGVSLLRLLSSWQPAWAPNLVAAAAAITYLAGVRKLHWRWPWWRSALFLAGLLSVLVALESGLDLYDDSLLSVHMVQHLLLLDVAPPLLLAADPVLLALRTLPRPDARRLARLLRAGRAWTRPAVCMAVYWVVLIGLHLPVCFDATLRSAALHVAEHGLFLTAGLLLWWPLHGGDPLPSARLGALGRLVYALVAMLPMDLIGAYLNRDPHVAYAPYADAAALLHVSAVTNQQVAGAVMWVAGTMMMTVGGLTSCLIALLQEERLQQSLEARV